MRFVANENWIVFTSKEAPGWLYPRLAIPRLTAPLLDQNHLLHFIFGAGL
jgi:hypothetical protein